MLSNQRGRAWLTQVLAQPGTDSGRKGIDLGQAFHQFERIFRLVWVASPKGTLVLAALTVIGGIVPPLLAWSKKLMIDQVVDAAGTGQNAWTGLRGMLPLMAMILAALLINSMTVQGQALGEKNLRSRLSLHINSLIMRKALTLDLGYFEDSEYYDKLQNAREEADQRALDIVVQSFKLIQTIIVFAAFCLLLIRFSPPLIVILIGATLPSFGMQNRYGQLTFRLLSSQAPERRQMKYLEELLTVDRYAKEVKLFGLGLPLLSRYTTRFWELFRADMALARRRSVVSIGWAALGLIGYFAAICLIVYHAIDGTITFGDAVLYLEVFEQSHYLGQALLLTLLRLYENSLFTSNVFAFLALAPVVEHSQIRSVPARLQHGLELRGVSFRYPGRDEWALRNISMTLYPGKKLALVGLNGAGKTTLVKLLAGLYAPTEGEILLDGVDLKQVDLEAWRKRIGVIFQDFVHYHFIAAENIGIGQIESMYQREQIVEAARKGGAHDVLANLPDGYDTMLGKWFENGHELSIGQWQKVALSRAFMRDAEILIMDEPTASLDAEQEYQIFQRLRELTEGKLTILISHRFSSVRMMDRIVVLEGGVITEMGSHTELMAQNGTYAHLFNTQAQGYR